MSRHIESVARIRGLVVNVRRRYDNEQRRKQPGRKFSFAAAATSTTINDARRRTTCTAQLSCDVRRKHKTRSLIYRFDYNGLATT